MTKIQWLQNWIDSHSLKKKYNVSITTIDNPGWGMTISLGNNYQIKESLLANVENSDEDWFYCVIKENQFQGDGGPFNLTDILDVFINYVKKEKEILFANELATDGDLLWILHWYASQCDGDWEHQFGVRMKTLDNLSWNIQISIQETELLDKEFQKINIVRTENNWIFCSVKNGYFEGNCGTLNLTEVLKIFREWASKNSFS